MWRTYERLIELLPLAPVTRIVSEAHSKAPPPAQCRADKDLGGKKFSYVRGSDFPATLYLLLLIIIRPCIYINIPRHAIIHKYFKISGFLAWLRWRIAKLSLIGSKVFINVL